MQIGSSHPRIDALDKVTGTARYCADVDMPGALHIKLLYADRPHAEILSIDTNEAEEMDGVVRVLTSKDVPRNEWGIIKQDREVLCSSRVRYIGDRVAMVIAETPAQAAAAVDAVRIEYQDLPVLLEPAEAASEGAFLIHEDSPGNLGFQSHHEWGNVDAAFQDAAAIVEETYHTPMQEHAFLEPEAGLAYYDEDGLLTVLCGGQSVHDDQHQISHALGLPQEDVRVVYGPIGGAFGGREEISIQILLALAAFKTKRPVRLVWSRTESIQGHCKRHAMELRYKWSADKNGKITGADLEITADAGAYDCGSISVMKNYIFAAVGPYNIPNIRMHLRAVYTNKIPGGAFRGYGFPQTTFASELQVARLAEKLGIDPVTMRTINCYREGSTFPTQSPIPAGVNLENLVRKCALEIGFNETPDGWEKHSQGSPAPHIRRGIGIAAGMKSSGFSLGFPEGSEAKVVLHGKAEIERAEVFTASPDVGQGVHTAMLQIAAEALQVPASLIEMKTSDTKIIGDSGPASASRLTLFAGNAVKLAAEQALERWQDEDRPAVGHCRWDAPKTSPDDHITAGEISVNSMLYGAHAVQLAVDIETGNITVERIAAAHDPGASVNRQQVEGQIEGGVIQALGWSLYENFILSDGAIQTDTLSTYLVPTVSDIPPQVASVIDELPDPLGPFGARGIGEITFIPLAPAIIDAIHDATGVWINSIPVTPEVMLDELDKTSVT